MAPVERLEQNKRSFEGCNLLGTKFKMASKCQNLVEILQKYCGFTVREVFGFGFCIVESGKLCKNTSVP